MFGIYLWKGEDHFGNRKSGELEAKNRREAENKLLSMGIVPEHLSIKKKGIALKICNFFSTVAKKLKTQKLSWSETLRMMRTITMMHNTGLPTISALKFISTGDHSEKIKRAAHKICELSSSGIQLSTAFSATKQFPDLVVTLIAVSEKWNIQKNNKKDIQVHRKT